MKESDEGRKRLAASVLKIDLSGVTRVEGVLSKTPIVGGVVLRGIRWTHLLIPSGERLGYYDGTPEVLYILKSASH